MAAGEDSQTIPVQVMHVFLFYANCEHAILIPVRVLYIIY